MSKDHISATVDEDVSAYLSQDHINTSGLINDLVKQYMDGGDEQAAILRLREEQLRSEIEALSQQQEAKEQELDRLTESRQAVESGPDASESMDDILEHMEQDGVHYWADNEAIRKIATEVGTDAEDIIHRLKHRAADQGRDIYHTQFERADLVRGERKKPVTEVYGDE